MIWKQLRLALLVALWGSAHAIFEEQAGQVDWKRQNLGRVLHAEFAFRGRERVFVATLEGVVASLDTRDGSIAWRQVMEDEDPVDALSLVPRPASVLTLSRGGRVLRAWHALDGAILWEKVVADTTAKQQPAVLVLPDITGDGSSEVAVVSGTKLQVLSAPSGKLVWSATLPGSAEAAALTTRDQQPVISVAVAEAGGVYLRTFEAKTGAEGAAKQLCADAQQAVVGSAAAAVLTTDGQLCVSEHGAAFPVCKRLKKVLGKESREVKLGSFLDATTLPVLLDDAISLIRINKDITAIASHSGYTAADAIEGGLGGLAGVTSNGRLTTLLLDLAQHSVLAEADFESLLLPATGRPLKISKLLLGSRKVGEYSKPDSTLHRWLAVAEDDSLYFLEGSQVVWRREEGLASIVATLFVDLPSKSAEGDAQQNEPKATLMDRVNAEILTIKNAFGFIQQGEREELKQLNRRISTHLLPHRDANGFRKLILALSSSGKLFGLHSGDGRIRWQLPLHDVRGDARLFLWRSSHDAHQAPEVLVLSSDGVAAYCLIVNAHTGKVLEGGTIPGALQQVIELPEPLRNGSTEQHIFALVSEQHTLTILPDSADAKGQLAKYPFHFWLRSKDAGVLSGYRLSAGAAAAEQLWTVAFSGPRDTILRVAAKDPSEHIYSYAKVLGNRSLKLKYLNPNAIFVVTGPPDGAATSALADPTLTVHLIDTVTGQILYRQSLQGAKGPVNVVLSENWAVYSYYSTANARHEVAVLEFYDASLRSLSIPSLLFGTQNNTLSSFSPVPIEVLHQSYFTPIGLKTMAVTATRRGISSKQLLFGTNANQVYLMDKRFVDPRRPRGAPTADEKAEMLPPYSEELSFVPQQFASHKETIEALRGIVASPANLESTTLTLAYGLDLFFTRVQPSKTFDLLPDDFPYALLVLVTASLTVGAFILQRMDAASSLKRKWL